MRVLITGGAGFIGSHLFDAFTRRGDEVTVLDNLSTGKLARLPDGADVRRADITDAAGAARIVGQTRPDVICHLAAQIDVRKSVEDPGHDAAVNIGGTINLLQCAHQVGARLVFASTGGALYGRNAPIPSPEETLPAPEAPYGTAKYCVEQYLALFNRLYGTRHTALRLGNVYGPRQDPGGEAGVVAIFCGRIAAGAEPVVYGDGKASRDYVHVSDVADAFLAAADHTVPGIWNIGTGQESSVLDLLALVAAADGHRVEPRFEPARPGELQRSALDCTSAERELGWRARTPIEDGIADVYAWVQAGQPDRAA